MAGVNSLVAQDGAKVLLVANEEEWIANELQHAYLRVK